METRDKLAYKSLRQEKPQLVLGTEKLLCDCGVLGMESRGGMMPEKVSQGRILQDKRVLDFYCECDGKTRGGFKQGIGIRVGFLSKESLQLLCGEKAVEKENGGQESKRLC